MASDRNENRSLFGTIVGSTLAAIGGAMVYGGYRDKVIASYVVDTPLTKLQDIPSILDKNPNIPIYTKLVGQVGSDFPITSEHTHEQAAIVEKKIQGVWYSFRYRESNLANSDTSESKVKRPFYIHEGKGKLRVTIAPSLAEKCDLEKVHVHEERGGNFLLSLTLGLMGIAYPYKYIHTEYILPLNRNLLILGNVSKTQGGTITVNPPKTGFFVPDFPGVITMKSQEEHVEELEKNARSNFLWGGVVGALGVLTVVGSQLSR